MVNDISSDKLVEVLKGVMRLIFFKNKYYLTSARGEKLFSALKYIKFSVFFILARSFFLIQYKSVRQ